MTDAAAAAARSATDTTIETTTMGEVIHIQKHPLSDQDPAPCPHCDKPMTVCGWRVASAAKGANPKARVLVCFHCYDMVLCVAYGVVSLNLAYLINIALPSAAKVWPPDLKAADVEANARRLAKMLKELKLDGAQLQV